MQPTDDEGEAAPVELRGLLLQLNDLKRMRSAGRSGSIATRLFRRAWSALQAEEGLDRLMCSVTASAIAACRLGDLNAEALSAAGLSVSEATTILTRGFDASSETVAEPLRRRLRRSLERDAPLGRGSVPSFVEALVLQPRCAPTGLGEERLVPDRSENHAEHCCLVAVYGAILSPAYGADPALVFLAGLAHHLHHATMPDLGREGEVILGESLDRLKKQGARAALDQLEPPLRGAVDLARKILHDAGTPEGKAFHAADILDEAAQIAHYRRAASKIPETTAMRIVQDGPLSQFHQKVLSEMNLP